MIIVIIPRKIANNDRKDLNECQYHQHPFYLYDPQNHLQNIYLIFGIFACVSGICFGELDFCVFGIWCIVLGVWDGI